MAPSGERGDSGIFSKLRGKETPGRGKTKTQLRHDVTSAYPSHVSGALQTDAASEVELSSTPNRGARLR